MTECTNCQTLQAERDQARQQLATAEAERDQARQQLATAEAERDQARQQLATAEAERDQARQQLATAEAERDQARQQLATAEAERDQARQQLATAEAERDQARQQLATLETNFNGAERQNESLKRDLESCINKLNELTEECKKLTNTSGIDSLRDLFKQLSDSQKATLREQSSFYIDTFEPEHNNKQTQCSTQYVQSILRNFKVDVFKVIQQYKGSLSKMKQAREQIDEILICTNGGTKIIIEALEPVEKKIREIETEISGWIAFESLIVSLMNKSNLSSELHNEITEQTLN